MEQQKKIYTGQAAKILHWMQQGLNQSQAANAVGVDKTYANQLCKEESFKEQIKEALKADFQKTIEIENYYRNIEHNILKQIETTAAFATSLPEQLAVLKVISAAKPKSPIIGSPTGNSENTEVVKIVLPNILIQQFLVNPNSEVVAVGDRNLVTLNSSSIDGLAQRVLTEELEDAVITNTPNIDVPKQVTEQFKAVKNATREYNGKDKWGDL